LLSFRSVAKESAFDFEFVVFVFAFTVGEGFSPRTHRTKEKMGFSP
jgi:hypothetical protein